MSTERRVSIAKKACIRCRTQKRRCDRAISGCGLCTRLHQICEYETARAPSSPSLISRPEIFLGLGPFTSNHLRDTIIQKLGHLTPDDALSVYCRAIEPWFPLVSVSMLQSQLPRTWDEASLDVALLCLCIILLSSTPPSSPEDDNNLSEFKALYLYTKSCMTSTESLGINSFLIVKSRIFVTIFEVVHGFYPAAYISIGSTVRAADALEIHSDTDTQLPKFLDSDTKQQERILNWCGILIVDRYITVESGPHSSLTRSRSQIIEDILKLSVCQSHLQHDQDRPSPFRRLSHLVEASSLLDKVHNILNSPTPEHAFNLEELLLTVQALINLQTILHEEMGNEISFCGGGLGLCNTALLLAFENGSKVPSIGGATDNCSSIATPSLLSLLSNITNIVEPFTLGAPSVDFNFLPPFVTFLVYKVAAIITERLWRDDNSDEGLRKLRILRNFLRIVGGRWLGCKRYLKLLDEDTTPRILKALEQG